MYEIPKDMVLAFKEWNTCTMKKNSTEYDKRLVHALLLMCVEKNDLAALKIEDGLMNFIRGMLTLIYNLIQFQC